MSRTYTIPISGLKEGRHTIDFEIDNKFFEKIEESEVKEGSFAVNVVMDKRSTHLDLAIRITGIVRICCDRCLEMFFYPIDSENRLPSFISDSSIFSKNLLSISKSIVWRPSFNPLNPIVYEPDISSNFGLQKYESFFN
jgi:hypothetical protein